MSDEQLDVEIDRAVREMMSVDAPGGFRARILSRLEDRPRRFGWLGMAGLGGAVAAAAIVLVMLRENPPADPVAGSAPPLPIAVLTELPGDPVGRPERPHGDMRRIELGRASTGRASDRVVAADVGPQPTIVALAEIDPLFVSPVTARSIDPAAITIAPLAVIPEVQLKPLAPPDGRN